MGTLASKLLNISQIKARGAPGLFYRQTAKQKQAYAIAETVTISSSYAAAIVNTPCLPSK